MVNPKSNGETLLRETRCALPQHETSRAILQCVSNVTHCALSHVATVAVGSGLSELRTMNRANVMPVQLFALAAVFLACACTRSGSSTAAAANSPPLPAASPATERAPTTAPTPHTNTDDGASRQSSGSAPLVVARDDTPEERLTRYRALWKSPRHHPAVLDDAPRPARLAPGAYACRVSREYRLRECTVERDAEGRTFLEFAEGNLLGMRGVVYDRSGTLEFEGWLAEEQPFGCTSCQDRCIAHPGTCGCDPLPPDAVVECLKQPLRMTLRPTGGGKYHGTLDYRVYYNEYVGEAEGRHPEGFVGKQERFEVDIVPGPPPAPRE